MTNHPSFHTFSGAMGFLMEAENEREQELQNRREQAARQQELDDVYNSGVDDYNQLVDEFNLLNRRYKSSIAESEKYRKIALELAQNYQSFYNEVKDDYDQTEALKVEIEQLKQEVIKAKSQTNQSEQARKKVVNDAINLQTALKSQREQNLRLVNQVESLKTEKHKQVLSTKVQHEKLNQIQAGFHKVTSESNGEKLTLKFVFTKFKVLKNVIEHLIAIGQLNKSNIEDVEQVLIKRWDGEDNKLNTVTASEAGAYLAIENPDLFSKLKIS